jgi:hypothetical protein
MGSRRSIVPSQIGLDQARAPSRYQNRTYVLPNVSAGAWYMVYSDRAHIREAGVGAEQPAQTWDQYADYVRRLTKTDGGAISRLGGNLTGGGAGFLLWSLNNTGRYLSDDARRVSPRTCSACSTTSGRARAGSPR